MSTVSLVVIYFTYNHDEIGIHVDLYMFTVNMMPNFKSCLLLTPLSHIHQIWSRRLLNYLLKIWKISRN